MIMSVPIVKMASLWTLQFHPLSVQSSLWVSRHRSSPGSVIQIRWNRSVTAPKFRLRAINGSKNSEDEVVGGGEKASVEAKHPVAKFQSMVSTLPPVVFLTKRHVGNNFVIWLCIATAFLVVAVRVYVARKSRNRRPGSVADLVRRGQLRPDRRGISKPLKYEDPFNNPMVKVGKNNSTVEMCGKVYRLAPVTLTEDEQAIHQKRRSRAYQWKRPTVFLKEGDSIPPDVDPDTVRWIPANHPFATTASDIDEDLAQTNVYQKHGVPFRIKAEHEALQRKLEAMQTEQKLNKLFIDGGNAKDFERPSKLNPKSNELLEQSPPFSNQTGEPKPSKSDSPPNSANSSSSEDMQKP